MYTINARLTKLLRMVVYPAVVVILGLVVLRLGLFAQVAPAGEEIAVRLIVVNSREDAQSIVDQLKAGVDFGVLAREKSVDATSIDGGLLGKIDPAALRPELRDALRGLEPGRLSNIVRIPTGYAVLEVLTDAEASGVEDSDRARQAAISAEASIRYGPRVSGFDEVEAAVIQLPKPDDWSQDLHAICAGYREALSQTLKRVEDLFDPLDKAGRLRNKDAKPIDVIETHVAASQLHAYANEMVKAVEQLEIAERIALSELPGAAPQVQEMLGMAYLHKSEVENDVYRHPGDRCLFPMSPDMRYTRTTGSTKAVQYFLKYLDQVPDDIEVRWLLNLSYMTLGQYPSGVPKKYLLPLTAATSSGNIGRFTDVAPQAGLNLFAEASGVVVDDFDNDGLFDVVTSTIDSCEPMHFFHNNGDGTFTDHAAKAGLSDQTGGLNLIQTDYNNDGCKDILVLRGGWEGVGERKSLLRNNCDGTFTDVTKESGLAKPATNTQAAVWADINNDGLLDLFVGNERQPSQLFLNKGDGTFEDISHSAGIDRTIFAKGVVAADYDHDGYVDFYVTNGAGANLLFHNNRNGTFTEIARQAGVEGTGQSFATWFFDYDNDGWPDLYVNTYNVSVEESVKPLFGFSHGSGTLKLYRNLGNGAFRDVTKETGLDRVFMPMGANFGDIDNDGYPDIYLGTGNPSYGALVPNVLLRNEKGKSFEDVAAASGTGELHKGHGVAFADIDNDGDEDILTSVGGAVPGDRHAFRLFQNPGNGNDWIGLRLVGVKANRAAIGARIKVTVKNDGQTRAVYQGVGSGGSFGASPIEQHIGLGKSAQIESIEIWWPDGSTTPQTFSNVGKNQVLEIKQFATEYAKLARHPFRLGGVSRLEGSR